MNIVKKKELILKSFRDKININNNLLWKPSADIPLHNLYFNSCFDSKIYTDINSDNKLNINIDSENDSSLIKSVKINFLPTREQKNILNVWFDAYTKMYNIVISYLKEKVLLTDLLKLKKYKKIADLTFFEIKNIEKYNKNIYTKLGNKKINHEDRSDLIKKLDENADKLCILRDKNKQEYNNKNIYYKKIFNIVNFQNTRDLFYDKKQEIIKLTANKQCGIKTHIIDACIKYAVNNYSTSIKNFINNNCETFKLKYWKNTRKNKFVEIESTYITQDKTSGKNYICKSVFGEMKLLYNNKPYILDNIKKTIKIHYNGDICKYEIHIPVDIQKEQKLTKTVYEVSKIKNDDFIIDVVNNKFPIPIEEKKEVEKRNFVGIDPGVRTFATCLSENQVIKLGTNIGKNIEKYLEKIDKLKGKNKISKKIIKKNEKIINRKITNMVDELHWKTIKYLTDNYKNILVGDLSFVGIKNLSDMNKRIGNVLSYHKFRTRLKYKSKIRNVNYLKVNESYTSKICSNCGNEKKNLGDKKIYNCEKCKMTIDRDINGCRGKIIKGI
jgi:IS605 OrfB family transposase